MWAKSTGDYGYGLLGTLSPKETKENSKWVTKKNSEENIK